MKKIIILGASGVIGQYMRLCIPDDVEPIWVRSKEDRMHVGMDLSSDKDPWVGILLTERPFAVINLAGQGNVDAVGRDPEKYYYLNVIVPEMLARFCQRQNIHYVHVSSQAVFNGENPPYHADSTLMAINAYGRQKMEAEQRVKRVGSCWTIVRPSFVMGIRPIQHLGRMNPAEQMIGMPNSTQVADRWFTACDATTVAQMLWKVAVNAPQVRAIHVEGTPRVSRYDLATALGGERTPARHEDFPQMSPRPRDTTFTNAEKAMDTLCIMEELRNMYEDFSALGFLTRARELSLFTGKSEYDCRDILRKGFGELHQAVTDDFRRTNPQTDDDLLEWYRETNAYILELTAYHLDKGFNYSGMCNGVAAALNTAKAQRVLCLGDGIGDMTLALRRAGIDAIYHDLYGSRTADFACMRLWMYGGYECESLLSTDWNPPKVMPENYDAVCAADFMEHLPNVEDWVRWIMSVLKPGGMLFAQNAFACGSGPNGGMPMHLDRNDRFEKDWDPFLASIGLEQVSSNWYKKPEGTVGAAEPRASVSAV